jgi:rhamnose transport system permease protein
VSFLRSFGRHLVLLVAIGLTLAIVGSSSPRFLEIENLLELSRHLAEAGIIASGMTLIIMTGGIDLSVGSLLGLSGIVLGFTWKPLGPAGAIAASLTTGLIGGALNGALVAGWNLPPLVVTLATMALYRGLAMGISQARSVSQFADWFLWIGQGHFLHVPVQLWVWLITVIVIGIVASRTRLGRYTMALGDNEMAARFAALPVAKLTFLLYVLAGVLSAIAAIVFTSRVATARADSGTGLELEVITAVVLGGTSITGGRGTILGSFVGVLVLGILRNGLSIAGIPSIYQTMLAGALLIVTAIANQWVVQRESRRGVQKRETAAAAA